jgi:two-component sensor histidine kinase
MKLDVATLALIASVIFACQTIAFLIQYKVNEAYQGPGWWLAGTMLQSLGFFFMLTLNSPSIHILSIFANPLIFCGQIFLYLGVARFLGKAARPWPMISLFSAFILLYFLFVFVDSSIFIRSIIVSASAAIIAALTGYRLARERKRQFAGSALFAAAVFLSYGAVQAALTVTTLALPRMNSFDDFNQEPVRILAFIIPIIGSMLWSSGFINMVNQRLNADNLAEKDKLQIVLKEVHHRIKNNMSAMMSLLNLQAGSMKDAFTVSALEDASNRLQSMEILYDKLYQSTGFTKLSVKAYLPSLVEDILANFPGGDSIRVEQDIEDFALDAKRLQPLGIIINELLTNVMKYAFAGREGGTIAVAASLASGHVAITVADDGVGIPPSVDIARSPGFGLMLVQALTAQLEGTIRIERAGGTRVILEFEL